MAANPPNPPGPAGPPSGGGNTFSLEDLDKLIEADSPGFNTEMSGIKEAGVDAQANIESLSVDDDGGVSGLDKEEDLGRELTKKEKILFFLKYPWMRVSGFFKLRWMALRNRTILFANQTVAFVRNELPDRLRFYRARGTEGAKAGAARVKGEVKRFLALTRVEKFSLIFTVFAAIASVLVLSRTLTGAWLPSFSDPLPRALSKSAAWVKSYQTEDDLQDLFNAFPEIEFYVLLDKAIVNLRPDMNSGRNPMGVYEVYLGVDSQDTAIEVKDREREVLDIIQRALEGFSYSEVISTVGKVRMKGAIRDRVNEALNQGLVHHVYFNTFITTP